MNRRVTILDRAEADVDEILHWMARRSPSGADAWYDAFQKQVDELARDAARYGVATEFRRLNPAIRQAFFKTRRGKRYRVVFLIVDRDVRILRVRGPGQKPLRGKDIPET
jgi:plasmid stabilization system protein ParE